MNSIFYLTVASSLTAISNLCVRRSIEVERTAYDPYLLYRLIASGFAIFVTILFSHQFLLIDWQSVSLGIVAGLFLGLLMWLMGKALDQGPAGLSFAILNATTIVPPMIMVLLFGSHYGFYYSFKQGFGTAFVAIGLLWAGFEQASLSRTWILYIIAASLVQILYLTFFQWRALLLNPQFAQCRLIPFHCSQASKDTFVLIMYAIAAGMQFFLNRFRLKSNHAIRFALYGLGGGIINGLGGFCMILATEVANSAWQKSILFPFYAVLLIFLCNVWAYALYREKINWYAMILCFIGIAISSL